MTAVQLARLLAAPALEVAPALLGGLIRHRSPDGPVAIRLTEVEAYSGNGVDPAAHSHRGPTPRTEVMFGEAGRLYVYFSYGMHWCANVVCGPPGMGEAVLLRAGEVVEGIELARSRRSAARRDVDLARGPARLTQALGVTGPDNGSTLLDPQSRLLLTPPGKRCTDDRIRSGPRVGITKAAELPWRFWIDGEATVSRAKSGHARRRR